MRNRWLGFIVAAIAIGVAIWAYPQLPPRVATHWNIRGEADGYSSPLMAAAIFPIVILVMAVVVHILPRIDPKGRNYPKFHGTYWLLMNGVLVFMGIMHAAIMASAVGLPVPMRQVIPLALGFLFIVVGNYLGRVEPNWFLGIRTPWTLSSDTVWRKTHRLGAWAFVAGGVFFMASAFVPIARSSALLGPTVAIVVLVPVLYSLYLWKQEQSS